MKTTRPLRTLSTTVAIAALIVCLLALTAPSANALFTNGSFEDGTLNGWTLTTFLNFGLSGSAPFTGASIVRTAGGTDLTQVLGPFAAMSQSDANTGGVLHYPLSGSYCAVVNFQGKNRNANSLLQQGTVTAGNVAPDGKIHVQLAWAAVVQNPAHLDTQQPYVYMALRNVSKGTLLYEAFEFAGAASIWQNAASSVQFTDWQVMDIAPDISALAPGDKVEVEAIAAGCSLSGHWGYLYVDRFGSFFPVTPHVTAADKIYDGTTDATITGRTLSGVVPGDDVSLTGGTATFDTATIGAGKTVTATGLSLTGADADKYMLTSFSATTTASIVDLPVVTTTTPSAVTAATADSGGDVTTDNASAVTARGVCWSTAANPTIADSHTVDGTGTGVFSSQMTGLADNTLYHVRAYATNQAGTSYGSDLTFTTDMFVDFVTDGTAGATLTGNAGQHVPSGGAATAVTADAPVGHHFVEWTFSTGGSSTDNPLTIDPVTASITVTAHFDIDVNTITASAGANGKISPAGAVSVDYGSDQVFAITPDAHYHVADVLVDGVSQGARTTYTFTDVTGSHTITASFARNLPPITHEKGAPPSWVNRAVTVHLIAHPSAGGAPVAYTEYRIGSGPWIRGTTVTITRQGTTVIRYRSVDTDGNVEVIRICRVFIDTTPPTVRDGDEVNVFRGGLAGFTYRLSDNLAKSLHCWLVIRHHGKVVSRTPLGLQPVGRLLSTQMSCTMRPGLYSWRIIAKDTAGNAGAGAWQELEVKLARH